MVVITTHQNLSAGNCLGHLKKKLLEPLVVKCVEENPTQMYFMVNFKVKLESVYNGCSAFTETGAT